MTTGLIQKHVGETLVLGFRYHAPALDDDEILTGVNVSVQSGLTAGTASIDGAEVSVPVSGGSADTDYIIRFTVTTNLGQVFVDDYLVKVIA